MYFTNAFIAALAAQAFSRDSRISSSGAGKLAVRPLFLFTDQPLTTLQALMALGATPGSALPIFTTIEVREVSHKHGEAVNH